MSQMSECHTNVDAMGVGKCSVPVCWGYGAPAGFCDEPAFGERPPGSVWTDARGEPHRDDGRYAGYVPGLACPCHGGPNVRLFMDGNQWCAVHPDFVNLVESPAGFGDTREAAEKALAAEVRGSGGRCPA